MPWLIREEWDSRSVPDIYFTHAYMDCYRTDASKPMLFEFTDGSRVFNLPFMETSIRAFFPEADADLKDMETAYGYGGCWSTSSDADFLRAAMGGLEECCRQRKIVAGFLRFHPVLANQELAPAFQLIRERETVCVDLLDADIWNHQISQKNRNMIRKAEKEGITFQIDESFQYLEQFQSLYEETMERLGAHTSYRFTGSYFQRMRASLIAQGFLAHCRHGGEIVSSAIIMTWGPFGHYHLSASKSGFLNLAPNNLMLYKTLCLLKERGLAHFHLGGGTTSDPKDPLLKFKKSFSGHTKPYWIGKRVFMESEYARLRDMWNEKFPERIASSGSRILFYRY